MGSGFAKRKKQAKMMQEQFGQMQEQMQNLEVIGSAGNGLVTITLNGDGDMKKVVIKPDCVDPEDIEGLQDLIKAAYTDAQQQLKESSPKMPSVPPGMMPGMSGGGGLPPGLSNMMGFGRNS